MLNIHLWPETKTLGRAGRRAEKWGQTLPKQFLRGVGSAVGVSGYPPASKCHLSSSRKARFLLSSRSQHWEALGVSCADQEAARSEAAQHHAEDASWAPGPNTGRRGVRFGFHGVFKYLEVLQVPLPYMTFLAPIDIGVCNPCLRPQFWESISAGC